MLFLAKRKLCQSCFILFSIIRVEVISTIQFNIDFNVDLLISHDIDLSIFVETRKWSA